MNSLTESLIYYIVRFFGIIIRRLPLSMALSFGRAMGILGYYFDAKHKSLAYANLKIAFAKTKKPSEIKCIVKRLFQNFGMNVVELLRLPLILKEGPEKYVRLEGKEHIDAALKEGKGLILLPPHFGSWEISSLMSHMAQHPYRVVVKPQKRHTKLDEILNSYRECAGSVIISRGSGTREIIESLRKNEIIGMVADQGGKDGVLVKFFGREASMSVGAIRLALKFGTPVCFAIIIREKGPDYRHRLVIHPAFELIKTGNTEQDVAGNLEKVVKLMESYIEKYPDQYVWFYKIWKYSKESATVIIHDGKVGHLRQSQAVAKMIDAALAERGIHSETQIVDIHFKNAFSTKVLALLSFLANARFCQGRMRYFKWFLTKESYRKISSIKADYVVSCGSAGAGANFLLSSDCRAKSIAILTPGLLGFDKFNLVILPQHDRQAHRKTKGKIIITEGAPNLIDQAYLESQSLALMKRFPHIKKNDRCKIGILLGGAGKNNPFDETQARLVISQIKEVAKKLNAEILVTTSRRTPAAIGDILENELKGFPLCVLLVIANKQNFPEVIGGILGLSDLIVVTADSISMISEAACSKKGTIVYLPKQKEAETRRNKHRIFVEQLHAQGHVVASDENHLAEHIDQLANQAIKTKPLDDNPTILEAIKKII
ncbi:MAG: ELM1/GtrOC1 family putative glycosyltransferase [Candidatus Omnitrophota bacterium]